VRRSSARTRAVRAGVEADDGVDLLGPRGQHQDRLVRPHLPYPATDLQAVHVRQPEVEEDQVEAVLDRPLDAPPSLCRSHDLVALVPEHPLEGAADVLVVFHEEDPGHRRRS
jgi:hypothetical protein